MDNCLLYIIIAVILFAAELIYFKIAERFGIVDRPNARSSHHRVVLRGGGIIFLVGAWIFALISHLAYPWMIAGTTLIGCVSFADDIHPLPNRYRLLTQFTAVLLMMADMNIYEVVPWWIIAIALIITVGVINAYNFMDGINGITGAYSFGVLLPLMWLNRDLHFIDESFLYVTGISLLVFCYFNCRRRARCFAGDVGSITIAFLLLFALGRLIVATSQPAYILLISVYGVDSILTIIHRLMLHEHLGQAHRKHAYQLMSNELHIPHLAVASLYMILQLAVSAGLIFIPINQWVYFVTVCVVLAVTYVIFMRRYYPLHEAYLASLKQ